MDTLKKDLERRRATIARMLQTNMRSTRDRSTGRAEAAKDPYGSASVVHDDELAAITVDRLSTDLQKIDHALADLDAGRYGICAECGTRIAPKRLKALPFASLCIDCQAASERLQRAS